MALIGWSSADMAARYQHVTDPIRHEVARQVDDLIWQSRRSHSDGDREADSADTVPVQRGELAVILELADRALPKCSPADAADARQAVEHVRAILGAAAPAVEDAYITGADGDAATLGTK